VYQRSTWHIKVEHWLHYVAALGLGMVAGVLLDNDHT